MSEVPNAAEPPKNPEKMHDLHTKIRPYVPTAYQDCGLYDAPPDDVVTKAMEIKKARRAQQANKRKRSKDDDEGKSQNNTLIPPAFTWERIRQEYLVYLDGHYVDTPRPSESSFLRILTKRCPNITIRSGRDQVCDLFSIYRMRLGKEANASDAEVFGDHLTDARAMRIYYQRSGLPSIHLTMASKYHLHQLPPSLEFFEKRYKKLEGIQKFQLFHMARDRPGQVECCRTPASEGKWVNLLRHLRHNIPPDTTAFDAEWRSIPKATNPPANPEKVSDIYKKVLPFVPAEFANDPLYQKPTADVEECSRSIKRSCQQKANAKRKKKKSDEGKNAIV
ncbi:hypothetical protein BBJ28_00024672 [Nothophytophthora sp. Chile5]|nr:hypothetical protein BBJ28_00024672 [Nothophytophthora sp. Chile5]